ncbi:hypothetical protein H0H92_009877 [Tricholoma furcatifolium]|nr:hypothetical protein H0H92_009877 [Tricholoma furcatifolium]
MVTPHNDPVPRPTFVRYTTSAPGKPAPVNQSGFAASHRDTTSRHHPYARKKTAARPAIMAAPIPPTYGYVYPVPSTRRRGPFYTPPHPLDPEFAIHPPMSPREIHRRQQVLRGRRLTALFCIPEFHHIVRSGWVAARLEEKRKEASMLALAEGKDDAAVSSQSVDD